MIVIPKKVFVNVARDNELVSSSRYIITGEKEEINSGLVILGIPKDTNTKSLANKMNNTDLGTGNSIDANGYIIGINPHNYVCFNINEDTNCTNAGEVLW